MNSNEIYARMDGVDAELRTIHQQANDRELSSDEQRRFDALLAERKGLERRAAVATMAGNSRNTEAGHDGSDYDRDPLADPASAESFRGSRNPWQLGAIQEFGRSRSAVAAEYRGRALDAIELMPGANDRIRAVSTEMIERSGDPDSKLAQLVLATSSPAYMRGWSKLARGAAAELREDERIAIENAGRVQRAMSLTDGAGGYMVPWQLDPTVILTSSGSRNDIRQAARQVVATGDKWYGVASTEVSWSWDAEGAEVSDDSPAYAQPVIDIFMARGFVPASFELLADAANATAELGRQLAMGKDTLEAVTFATGSGPGRPQGIVTGLVAAGSIVNTATADTFAVGDLYALEEALPSRFRSGGSWLGSKMIYNDVRQFGVSDGHALWERIGAGQPAELLGYPAREAEAMTGSITASQNNDILVFGDLAEAYVIADRVGTTVELVQHLFGANGRPTGQRGFFAHYRTGAGVVNASAARVLRA